MDDCKFRMVELMHLYLSGVITDEEMRELQEWLDAAPENKRMFDKVRAGKDIVYRYKMHKKVDHKAAYGRFEKRVGIKRRIFRLCLKYAAILLLPLGVIFVMLRTNRQETPEVVTVADILPGEAKAMLILADGKSVLLQHDTARDITVGDGVNVTNSGNGIVYSGRGKGMGNLQYNTLRTPRGGEYKITLSDGSTVQLNSATQLKFPVTFDSEKREVYLSGEAFFEVAKDSECPFYVIADGVRIRVYGTSFNVNTHDKERVRTVLVEGAIGLKAENGGQEYRMKPSQLGEFRRTDASIDVRTVDIEPYIAWKNGFFVFENLSMEQIMNTLSLWYDVDVIYANEQLKKLHFTGHVKRYEKIDNILKAIESAIGVTFSVQDRTISISK
ncbi:FecR domain-containing protein [uncultured Butyricimonas sp.]|uniref:FecR domain-containing protein n=1 Tax=uncultured Butyricimonas sp. TaxID=1268785 RepID=UPI0026DB254B|nr:FecR domain-containing protein [uncultured Butyricimonas sp.]